VRFLARIPYDSLWCDTLPTQYRLQLATQHDGRYEEYLELPLGFRTAEVRDGRMTINGREVALRCREVPGSFPASEVASLRAEGYNTLRLRTTPAPAGQLRLPGALRRRTGSGGHPAERRFAPRGRQPVQPTPLGVRPTPNAPRTVTTRPSCTRRSSPSRWRRTRPTAINLYESYLAMKRLHETRPFVYPEAGGEWNSDRSRWNSSAGGPEDGQ